MARSIGQAEAFEEAGAEAAVGQAFRAEEAAIEARAGFGDVENFEEQILEAGVSGDGAPLHFVLVDVGFEAEELTDAAVEIADGIGRILFVLERHVRAACVPARAAAEIAAAIERQHGGLFEGRRDSRPTPRGRGGARPR